MDQQKQTGVGRTTSQPKWWTDEHTRGWDSARTNLQNDFDQISRSDRGVMTGSQSSALRTWNDVEPAMRYGYGSYSQYGREHPEPTWTGDFENKLRQEWTDLKTGRTWDEVKDYVRRGWEAGKRKIS